MRNIKDLEIRANDDLSIALINHTSVLFGDRPTAEHSFLFRNALNSADDSKACLRLIQSMRKPKSVKQKLMVRVMAIENLICTVAPDHANDWMFLLRFRKKLGVY